MEQIKRHLNNHFFQFILSIATVLICMLIGVFAFVYSFILKIKTTLPSDAATSLFHTVRRNIIVMSIGLFVGIAILAVLIIIFRLSIQKRIREVMGKEIITEAKNWVLTKNSNDVIFEYDVVNDVFETNLQYINLFKRYYDNSLQKVIDHIHPEDRHKLAPDASPLFDSNSHYVSEIRYEIGLNTGEYIWCKVYASIMKNESGEIYRIIGKLVNVDTEKRSAQQLGFILRRDDLTGLLCKEATEGFINNYLKMDGYGYQHGLLLVKLDNYESINSQYGIPIRDQVMRVTAKVLANFFRGTDIAGRIEDDMFVILYKQINDNALIEKKANCFTQEIRKITIDTQIKKNDLICSIGASYFPSDGSSFAELYEKATASMRTVHRMHVINTSKEAI